MKPRTLFSILIVVAVVLLPAAASGTSDVWDERMFEGTIASRGREVEGLMYFPLKTITTVLEVQIGPKDFVDRSGFKPKAGEMVTVIGVPAILDGREALLAREVRTRSTVFVVRDPNGDPMWLKPVQMDPDLPESVMCEVIEPQR
jgi:hypothetical protein